MAIPVPPGAISRVFWEDARSYLEAAGVLIQNADNSTYFLLSHALELTIKSYLAAHGFTAKQLRDLGHDLQKAFNQAIAHGFKIDQQKEAEAMVCDLSEMHKQLVFRYSVNREGELVRIPARYAAAVIRDVVTAILQYTDAISWKAKLSAPPGPYSAEFWYMGGKP